MIESSWRDRPASCLYNKNFWFSRNIDTLCFNQLII